MKNVFENIKISIKTFLILSLLMANAGIYADDTEIFSFTNVTKPNVLFVLDISGSMNLIVSSSNGSILVERSIAESGSDAYQTSLGTVLTSETIRVKGNRNTTTSSRFRFTDIDIPQGALINNAYIQFESAKSDSNTAKFNIYSEQSDNASLVKVNQYSGTFNQGDMWTVSSSWSVGDAGLNQRADVTSVTQSVISRSGWVAGNAIAYIVHSKRGERTFTAFDHPTGAAPKLVIEYSISEDRLEVLQKTLRSVLETAPDNVRVGVMSYGQHNINTDRTDNYRHHSVSGVSFPVTDINALANSVITRNKFLYGLPELSSNTVTVREYIADIADTWEHKSATPIVDSLYEAALYFRGERMHYGQNTPYISGSHPTTYDGAVITNIVTDRTRSGRTLNSNSPKYISPVESSCQENYIVLMSDGAPTYYYDRSMGEQPGPFARIRGQTHGPQGDLADAITSCKNGKGVGIMGKCGEELTHYIAENDNIPDPSNAYPNGLEGNQFIKTFTIGFGIDNKTETYLKSLATYDDGNASTVDDGYFLATNPEELAAAFTSVFEEVATPKGTLGSPGYSVNVKNGLQHEKDIYIPVFERDNSSRWSGNLKKFSLVDTGNKRVIRGKNNLNATDELGNFTNDAIDYWSESSNANPDGADVQKGGVARLLSPVDRKVFSNLSGTSNVDLNTSDNELSVSNIDNLTATVLGLSSEISKNDRKKVINYMRGWKNGVEDTSATPESEFRYHMGDMLHSEPLVITYNKGSGADAAGKEQYIFAGTNEGYLHAFDTETGEEKFAFIPADLLSSVNQEDHQYGIDGAITGDFKGGQDGVLDTGDQVIIYFGLRRGGTAYYALDVTDIDNPELLWTKSAAQHSSMGQSWSTPYVATVGDSQGNPKEVVIVSGGYDEDEDRDRTDGSGQVDDSTVEVTANVGNDIFIFDAQNGTKIFSLSDSDRAKITSSIAGGVRPMDTNNNNLIDRIYFGDTDGNLWRLDLSEKIGDLTKPTTLTKLASLGGTGTNNRMFFNEPDVSLMRLNGRSVYVVSIGSGFRAHPLDAEINDKFFVVLDESPYGSLSDSFTTITETDLAKIDVSASGVVTHPNNDSIKDSDKSGWVIDLAVDGEKVLGDAVTINGSVFFGTLVPEVSGSGASANQCAAPVTYSRIYAIDILSGLAKWDFTGDGNPEVFTDPLVLEIIGKIQKVYNTPESSKEVLDEEGNPTGEYTCEHTVDLRVGKKSSQLSGYNSCRLDSVYWSDPVNVTQ